MATTALRAPRRAVLSGPIAYGLLAAAAVVLLVIGSVHPSTPSRASRISYLDSVIKCPSCVDISIGQSTEQTAVALRARVAQFVDEGWSNEKIESWVTARFGSNELLVPPSSGLDDLAWILPLVGGGLGLAALVLYLTRRRARVSVATASSSDEALVAAALAEWDVEADRNEAPR